MIKIKKIMIVGSLALLASGSVLANGLYIGGSVGAANSGSNSLYKAGHETVISAGNILDDVFDNSGIHMNSGISAGMHLGWQFNSNWSTELSYTDLGTSKGNSHYNWQESSFWNAGDLKQNYSIKSKAVDLSAKYTFPSSSHWKIFVEAGPAIMFDQMHYDESYKDITKGTDEKQATNPSGSQVTAVAGVGVGYHFRHMDLNLKTRYFADFATGTDKASSEYAYKPVGSDTSAWDVAMSADFVYKRPRDLTS